MDLSSMRPSSWNGVGAMAKVPAALWVSFVICASFNLTCLVIPGCATWRRPGIHTHDRGYGFRVLSLHSRPGMTANSKPSRAHLDLFLGEENLLGVFDNVLSLPSRVRRLPARL